ncbi:MAG: TolC family protein [Oligoflexia bacterium]|nr:TolC family protein [Oligoflexia bacterium]
MIFFSIQLNASVDISVNTNINLSNLKDLIINNNPDILLSTIDYQLAINDVDASKGDNSNKSNIDPSLSLAIFSKLDTLNSNSILDNVITHEKTQGLSLGISKEFSYGPSMEFSVQGMHIASDSKNAFAEERYQDAALLKTTIPLLKNWGYKVKMNQYLIADTKVLRYKEKLKNIIQDKITEGLNIYYDLIQAHKELEILNNTIKYYLHLQESITSKYQVGKENNVNLLDINARVAKEQSNIIQLENKIYNLKLKLFKMIISDSDKAKLADTFSVEINLANIITDLKNICINKSIDSNSKVNSEIKSNTNAKIEELKYEIDENELTKIKQKSNLYPDINFYIELLSTGLGRHHNISFKNMYKVNYPSIEVGINFTYLIENSDARGGYNNSINKIQSLTTKKINEINKLKLNINKNFNLIKTTKDEILLLEKRLSNQEEKATIKEKLFKNGSIELSELLKTIEEKSDLDKNFNSLIINCQKQINEISKINGEFTSSTFI